MDITIQREALLKPLQAISSVVDKKQTLPILSNVLLTVEEKDEKLRLTATDTEIEIIGFLRLESMAASGSTTVSAKKLFDICRALPESTPIRLSLDKQFLVIRAGGSRFKLNTLPPDTFPSTEENIYQNQLVIKQSQLKNLLSKTYFAMGQQDIRHYLNGTLLDITPHSIKCIAADGHRLAVTSIQDESIGNINAKIILPRKSVLELIRLLGDSDHDMSLAIGDGRCCITSPDFIFTTKLINTQYPDYNRLIPQGTMTASGDREAIKQALSRASILSNEKFRGVRFELSPKTLRISANNSDQEQADEMVALEYEGNQIEMGFNVAYLLDVLSALTSKTIHCLFSDPDSGVLLKSAENDHSIYVIMPMRF